MICVFIQLVQVSPKHDAASGLVDIGLAGHYLHGEGKSTPEMADFLSAVPAWATPVTWAATWDGHTF